MRDRMQSCVSKRDGQIRIVTIGPQRSSFLNTHEVLDLLSMQKQLKYVKIQSMATPLCG